MTRAFLLLLFFSPSPFVVATTAARSSGWYEAQVLEEMKTDGKYKVRFNESRAELLLPQKKVRDLVDWIEAEGKWVSVRRWEKPTGKESKDPAKSRKSKQNSKNQSMLES